jgi:hypothetical protein
LPSPRSSEINKNIITAYVNDPRISPSNRSVSPDIIIAAVSNALEMQKSANFENWRNSVGSKLDEISSKLDDVLAELLNLRVFITESIRNSIIVVYSDQIYSKGALIEDIVAGASRVIPIQKTESRENISKLHYELAGALYSLTNVVHYGFAGHQAVVSGCCFAILSGSSLDTPPGEFSRLRERLIDYLDAALDPSNERSLEFARNSKALEYVSMVATFNGILNRWWVISWANQKEGDDDNGPFDRSSIDNGDLENGRYYLVPSLSIIVTGDLDNLSYVAQGNNPNSDPFPGIPKGKFFQRGSWDRAISETRFIMENMRQAIIQVGKQLEKLEDYVKAIKDTRDVLIESDARAAPKAVAQDGIDISHP